MTLQIKIIIALAILLAINAYILLGKYRKEDSIVRLADSLKAGESLYKGIADKNFEDALQNKAVADLWRHKYDSMEAVAVVATLKADKLSKQYENLLHHPHIFASDFQRDSVLQALYPR